MWPDQWLGDLRADTPGSRALFDARCFGGLSLLEGQEWRYHSEYLNWETGLRWDDEKLDIWLQGGLSHFQGLFGYGSRSTIPPHYLFTPNTCRAWQKAGIQFIQGTNYRILHSRKSQNGKRDAVNHTLGERTPEGLTFIARNVKFDPRPQRPRHGVEAALEEIEGAFRNRVPAIVDTHRINYTGDWSHQAIEALASLLSAVTKYRPHILTTVELGEAINQNGTYQDVWTGQIRHLSSLDTPMRRAVRVILQAYHLRRAANATR
jgi:hypothetical protein